MEQEKQELSSDLKELEINKIYNMDCIECMKLIPDKSVDLIIADPPYYKTYGEFDFIFKNEENKGVNPPLL